MYSKNCKFPVIPFLACDITSPTPSLSFTLFKTLLAAPSVEKTHAASLPEASDP